MKPNMLSASDLSSKGEKKVDAATWYGNKAGIVLSGADIEQQQIHRHQCLVRELLRLREQRGSAWFQAYVRGWSGFEPCRDDFMTQWNAGNRGAHGNWRA